LKEWFVSYHFTSLGSLAVCRSLAAHLVSKLAAAGRLDEAGGGFGG
jgi:hypothetical protein